MTPLTKRGATVLLLVAIAIVLCAFLYSNTYDRSETERFGEVRLAPTIRRVQSQRYAENKTSRRLSGGADKPRNCVNYRPFINRLKFYPPVVVTKSMFSKVKRLVFFIGHQRSGSSLIGRLLDAHPHITIPHEFDVFNHWSSQPKLRDRTALFKALYGASAKKMWEVKQTVKHYGQHRICSAAFAIIPNQWQGKCNQYLEIIGDKKASATAEVLASHPNILHQMQSKLQLPMVFIYAIRHPLDMIATQVMRAAKTYEQYAHTKRQYNNTKLLRNYVKKFETRVAAVQQWIESEWINVLPVYNDEMVHNPKVVLKEICSFLQITCSVDYIDSCSKFVFSDMSRTRDNVYWSSGIKRQVVTIVKRYKLLSRYQYDL